MAEVTAATFGGRLDKRLSRGTRAAILRRMHGPSSDQAAWLVSVALLGAGFLVVHAMLLIRTARSSLSRLQRALAWLPPATPVIGWLAGNRVLSGLWVAQALAYVMLRAAAP